MKFEEFLNRNKNVIESSARRKITLAIPITEDRQKFYDGMSFKKYDSVTSDGVTYRILEQRSNYYTVVDAAGNTHRKFAKQLTPILEGIVNPDHSFHGYVIESNRGQTLLEENHDAIIDGTIDDVGLLKQLKEADKMDNTAYKVRDKLTIAKIIADAIGIPHDAVSSPENLVNQAIRKAAKDPAMLRNKEILQNMLKIAAEVGIRFSTSVFDKIEESTELDEAALNAWKNRMKTSGATHFKSDPTPTGSTASLLHAYKKDGEKKIKVGSFDQSTQRGVKESEELDELNIDTVKSYSDKAKKDKPETLPKVIKRFAGQERAQDRIHRDELKKIGTVKEDDMLTYAALMTQLKGD